MLYIFWELYLRTISIKSCGVNAYFHLKCIRKVSGVLTVQTYWHRPVIFVSDKTDNASIGKKVREDSEMLDMKWRGHTRQVPFNKTASHR